MVKERIFGAIGDAEYVKATARRAGDILTNALKDPDDPTICPTLCLACIMTFNDLGTVDPLRERHDLLNAAMRWLTFPRTIDDIIALDLEIAFNHTCKCDMSDPQIARLHAAYHEVFPSGGRCLEELATNVSYIVIAALSTAGRAGDRMHKLERHARKAVVRGDTPKWPTTGAECMPFGPEATVKALVTWFRWTGVTKDEWLLVLSSIIRVVGGSQLYPFICSDTLLPVLSVKLLNLATACAGQTQLYDYADVHPHHLQTDCLHNMAIFWGQMKPCPPDLLVQFAITADRASPHQGYLEPMGPTDIARFSHMLGVSFAPGGTLVRPRQTGGMLLGAFSSALDVLRVIRAASPEYGTYEIPEANVKGALGRVGGIIHHALKLPIWTDALRYHPEILFHSSSIARECESPFNRAYRAFVYFASEGRCFARGCTRTSAVEGKFSKCSGCGWISYCSRDCQKKAWKDEEAPHKLVCPKIKLVAHKAGLNRKSHPLEEKDEGFIARCERAGIDMLDADEIGTYALRLKCYART